MTDTDLITALRRIAVQDQHRCLGCGYEHNCGIHGCQIIRAAADRLKELTGKDSNVPTKTADEMFRELGYQWNHEHGGPYISHEENPVGGNFTAIEVIHGMIEKWGYGPRGGFHLFQITVKEALACAQYICEKEEKI